MRKRSLLILLIVLLTALPSFGQDSIGSDTGRTVVAPNKSENVLNIPIDPETGMVDWDRYLALPEGVGAKFGFAQVLFPPDPSTLADSPNTLLDSAWFPPIPFSTGLYPTNEPQTAVQGWMYTEDSTGYLARRDMTINDSSGARIASTWFLGGGYIFHIEEGWQDGYYTEGYYLPDEWTGPGIDFFLKTVWFKGVLEGDAMQRLLAICGAARIGRDRDDGGRDRLLIYEIQPNELDRQNGRGSLLIWVSQGYYRLERTRLHTVYAIEVTQYENLESNVELDPAVFQSEYLTQDLYVKIDDYLLTHRNPFLDLPSDLVYENPNAVAPGVEGESTDAAEVENTDDGDSTTPKSDG